MRNSYNSVASENVLLRGAEIANFLVRSSTDKNLFIQFHNLTIQIFQKFSNLVQLEMHLYTFFVSLVA